LHQNENIQCALGLPSNKTSGLKDLDETVCERRLWSISWYHVP